MRHRRLSADGTPEFYSMRCAERILYNYTGEKREAVLPAGKFTVVGSGAAASGYLMLPPYGAEILKK